MLRLGGFGNTLCTANRGKGLFLSSGNLLFRSLADDLHSLGEMLGVVGRAVFKEHDKSQRRSQKNCDPKKRAKKRHNQSAS